MKSRREEHLEIKIKGGDKDDSNKREKKWQMFKMKKKKTPLPQKVYYGSCIVWYSFKSELWAIKNTWNKGNFIRPSDYWLKFLTLFLNTNT